LQSLSATPQSTHAFSTVGSNKELRSEPSQNVHVLHVSPVSVLNELLYLILLTQPSPITSLIASADKPADVVGAMEVMKKATMAAE